MVPTTSEPLFYIIERIRPDLSVVLFDFELHANLAYLEYREHRREFIPERIAATRAPFRPVSFVRRSAVQLRTASDTVFWNSERRHLAPDDSMISTCKNPVSNLSGQFRPPTGDHSAEQFTLIARFMVARAQQFVELYGF